MAGGALTRTLALGVVALFEPLTGYQIRRELLSWAVEEWSDVGAGPGYPMRNRLQRHARVPRWAPAGSGPRPPGAEDAMAR